MRCCGRPDLVDYRQARQRSARQNLDMAFNIFERELGVTRLLDPEGRTFLIRGWMKLTGWLAAWDAFVTVTTVKSVNCLLLAHICKNWKVAMCCHFYVLNRIAFQCRPNDPWLVIHQKLADKFRPTDGSDVTASLVWLQGHALTRLPGPQKSALRWRWCPVCRTWPRLSYDTIPYNTVYFLTIKRWQYGQLNLAHGTEK